MSFKAVLKQYVSWRYVEGLPPSVCLEKIRKLFVVCVRWFICSQMKLWSITVYSEMSLHSIFLLDIPNMIYYLKVVTFKKWTKDSFLHNLLTSCWKSLMWIAELSDVFNRCQAVMNTAGSKVVRNWASSRCWRSQVKPRVSECVTRHLQRGWRGVSDA